jgi:hypothetical protein
VSSEAHVRKAASRAARHDHLVARLHRLQLHRGGESLSRRGSDLGADDDRDDIARAVRSRFAPDSPLEGGGFEPSVPRKRDNVFRACARSTSPSDAARGTEGSNPARRFPRSDRRSVAVGTCPLAADCLDPPLGAGIHPNLDRLQLRDHIRIDDPGKSRHLLSLPLGRLEEHVQWPQVEQAAVLIGISLLI